MKSTLYLDSMDQFIRFLHKYNRSRYDDEMNVCVNIKCIDPRCKNIYEQKFDLDQMDALKQAMDNFYGLHVPRKVLLKEIPEFGEEEIVSVLDLERRCSDAIQHERLLGKISMVLMNVAGVISDAR